MKYKKILILFIPLLLTGCFGKAAKGYLSSNCTKKEVNSSFTEITSYKIDFKEDKINNVTITKEYDNDSLKEELKSQQLSFNKQKGIKVNISDTKIEYVLDMNNLSKDMKNHFNLKDSYNDLSESLKKDGMKCE